MKSWLTGVGVALALTGCSAVLPPGSMPGGAAGQDTLVVPVGNGPATASIQIARPGYHSESLAHRWLASDVFEYDVTLLVKNASGQFVPVSPVAAAVLAQTGSTPSLTAQFQGLAPGVYQAGVVAKGNLNARDGSIQLNSTPASATLDLTSTATASTTVNVTFDSTPFDATATSTLVVPTVDGQWSNPSASATLSVQ